MNFLTQRAVAATALVFVFAAADDKAAAVSYAAVGLSANSMARLFLCFAAPFLNFSRKISNPSASIVKAETFLVQVLLQFPQSH